MDSKWHIKWMSVDYTSVVKQATALQTGYMLISVKKNCCPIQGEKGLLWSIYHQVGGWSQGMGSALVFVCQMRHLVVTTTKLALVSGSLYFRAQASPLSLSQWVSYSWTHHTRIRVTDDRDWLTSIGLVIMCSWLFSWLFIPWCLLSDGH